MFNKIFDFLLDNQYIKAGLILILFFLASKIITFLTERYFKKWSQKTETKLDDLIIEKLKPPFIYVLIVLGLQIALKQLDFTYLWLERIIDSTLAVFLIYTATIVFDIIIRFWIEVFKKKNNSKMVDSLSPLFKKTTIVVLLIIGLVWILDIWGFNVAPFLASMGIAGFVIGFAMQDSLKNIFGGVSLILDKTLQVGDKVSLEGGELGIVHSVTIRSTKIRTFDNELITIPNGRLAEMKIKNFTQPNLKLRVIVNFSTAYGSNIDKIKEVVFNSLNKIEGVEKEPAPNAIMLELADSGLDWQARFWVNDQSIAFDKKLEALENIYNDLNQNGISIPLPSRTVYLKNENS
ncbi:MAG: mechanosensitive ion channel family protein [Patescibacteria group bacterium]|nr:mechanosensitive ion channel family protein [Patescibacteria group bacterium]